MRFFKNMSLFTACIEDLIAAPVVRTMQNYTQHSMVSTLEHCLFVSYISFIICRILRFDYRSAARGGLLHDLFLYDWHGENVYGKLHGFNHPKVALYNACTHFSLNPVEQDIIVKHMWPLTLRPPKYRESMIVSFADKFCCMVEVAGLYNLIWIRRIMKLHTLAESNPVPEKA